MPIGGKSENRFLKNKMYSLFPLYEMAKKNVKLIHFVRLSWLAHRAGDGRICNLCEFLDTTQKAKPLLSKPQLTHTYGLV